jgi:hypothetical protein
MARPERNSVDYFPFFCEEGNKMFYLEETYGNDGFATFVKLLRELAKTEYHYLNLSKASTLMYLSAKCKISKEVLESIINDLVDLGKFDENLWKDNKVVWCQDFIDSIQDAYKKRNNKCITLEGLLTLLTSLGIRKQGLLPPKGSVNPQRKEKEIKEEKSKEEKSKEYTPNGVVDFTNQLPVHKIDFDKLLSFFNSNRGLLPEVKKMSETRKKRIQLLEKQYGKESIITVIQKTRDSPFLQGDNKENWTASFDWIFKPANFLKILEDNYENRENIRSINSQRTDANHKQSAVNAVNALFGVQ